MKIVYVLLVLSLIVLVIFKTEKPNILLLIDGIVFIGTLIISGIRGLKWVYEMF
ncbi:MAG: hypothetical protein WCO35_02040 [Candidatus Nomurabacteria bacterium]